MLSRRMMAPDFKAQNEQWLGGLLTAVVLFAILAFILLRVSWPAMPAPVPDNTIERLGQALVSPDQFVLIFEVSSVLLLVALVGAVVVARQR